MRSFLKPYALLSLVATTALLAAGCTYEGDRAPQSTTRPADAALKDPYGKWSNVNQDVSGGGVSNLNRDALKRDMDSFFLK
jgi:hypothetical protein